MHQRLLFKKHCKRANVNLMPSEKTFYDKTCLLQTLVNLSYYIYSSASVTPPILSPTLVWWYFLGTAISLYPPNTSLSVSSYGLIPVAQHQNHLFGENWALLGVTSDYQLHPLHCSSAQSVTSDYQPHPLHCNSAQSVAADYQPHTLHCSSAQSVTSDYWPHPLHCSSVQSPGGCQSWFHWRPLGLMLSFVAADSHCSCSSRLSWCMMHTSVSWHSDCKIMCMYADTIHMLTQLGSLSWKFSQWHTISCTSNINNFAAPQQRSKTAYQSICKHSW